MAPSQHLCLVRKCDSDTEHQKETNWPLNSDIFIAPRTRSLRLTFSREPSHSALLGGLHMCLTRIYKEKSMNKELSGAAGDVLHALFFRGALVDGNLPSKAGAAELHELGYMKTQDTVTPFCGEHHFNFLTPAGQEFAISYLVESRFGKKEDFQIGAGETFINNTTLQGVLHINPALTKVRLTDSMRDAVIAAVRESGQFVEKPTGDEQQSVVFRADRFKVTCEVSASGGSTTQEHEQILRSANAIIEAAKAEHIRQEAMMADLASAQAAITEHINQVVNDAIANALRPGGVLYAFRTRT